jgi:hypothetical protein
MDASDTFYGQIGFHLSRIAMVVVFCVIWLGATVNSGFIALLLGWIPALMISAGAGTVVRYFWGPLLVIVVLTAMYFSTQHNQPTVPSVEHGPWENYAPVSYSGAS